MASLVALFGNSNSDRPVVDDERLLDLYWNRNELKKEFASLRRQKYRLSEHVKQQQGDMARLEQKLEQLEQLLLDPDSARSVMVHFQLKGLGLRCSRKLAAFAEQLKQQREKKKHNQAVAAWRAEQTAEIDTLEAEIAALKRRAFEIDEKSQALRSNHAARGALVRLIKRRSVSAELSRLAAEMAELECQQRERSEQITALTDSPPPEVRGFVLQEKRLLNFMILSFAQQMRQSFDDDELVSLVNEATAASAGALHYGDETDCAAVMRRIARAGERLQRTTDAGLIREQARVIGEGAAFASGEDAVPVPATVSVACRMEGSEPVSYAAPDILGENYWGVADVLSR